MVQDRAQDRLNSRQMADALRKYAGSSPPQDLTSRGAAGRAGNSNGIIARRLHDRAGEYIIERGWPMTPDTSAQSALLSCAGGARSTRVMHWVNRALCDDREELARSNRPGQTRIG